ncbi:MULTISPECIES: hypothetical protein [unclassified Methanoregula]|uniref:hypothetical protein n=1 Tax=unclassified Methanoregula TaxID=2649730 RepID=UPI0009D5D10D|nr:MULTISPECIES: hypothetical protein [unclassified Methanoregula]OPX64067.1 MAG: hypothetical protein A4E33_01090 [Methanoregula sp. PtaB.Bin085]OPY33735.1 MAG: hypothetical protein A4E34_01673 [Methanoregula sp. PtaU1.Bin006]
MMNTKRILETAETLLFVVLILLLVMSAFIWFFVFCIDWEDWFFGVKLDGLPAGMYLSAKTAGAIIIIYSMAHYPKYRRQSVISVFAFYGFLCLDSIGTLLRNPHDTDYPQLMTGLFCLAMLLFIVHGTLSLIQPQDSDESRT